MTKTSLMPAKRQEKASYDHKCIISIYLSNRVRAQMFLNENVTSRSNEQTTYYRYIKRVKLSTVSPITSRNLGCNSIRDRVVSLHE